MRMLENEGFSFEGYIDIFDGGPTMTARTDKVTSVLNSREKTLIATECGKGERALIATGKRSGFRCCFGARMEVDGGLAIDSRAADLLDLTPGDSIWSIAR